MTRDGTGWVRIIRDGSGWSIMSLGSELSVEIRAPLPWVSVRLLILIGVRILPFPMYGATKAVACPTSGEISKSVMDFVMHARNDSLAKSNTR